MTESPLRELQERAPCLPEQRHTFPANEGLCFCGALRRPVVDVIEMTLFTPARAAESLAVERLARLMFLYRTSSNVPLPEDFWERQSPAMRAPFIAEAEAIAANWSPSSAVTGPGANRDCEMCGDPVYCVSCAKDDAEDEAERGT